MSTIDEVVSDPTHVPAQDTAGPAESPDGDTPERWPDVLRRLLILTALYAIPAVVLLRPVADPDIWWHLRTGQWVVEHHNVPQNDPFSAYGQTQPWVAYSWLFEVIVYGLYSAFGLTGLLLYRLLAAAAVLIAIHRFVMRREPDFVRATFLTGLTFFALVPLLNERPWLFTVLFTVWTLDAVLRLRDGTATWAVWLLPVAYALWANLHIQFIYGLAVLGLACLAPLADALLGRPTSGTAADAAGTRAWWRLVGLAAACALATLVNPYGPRLYAVVYEYASQPFAFEVVNELKAPAFRLPFEWVFLALAGAGAFALGRRPRPSLFEVLLLAGAAFAAFRARRDVWFLLLASDALLTTGPRAAAAPPRRFALTLSRLVVVAAAVAVFALAWAWHRHLSENTLAAAVAREYPVAAVEHIRESGYPGPLFNDFDWGGYLIWALPDHPVSMDGRTNLHGDARIERHVNTVHGLDYKKDDDLKKARLVVTQDDSPLASLLRVDPHFFLVYEDPASEPVDGKRQNRAAVFVARDD